MNKTPIIHNSESIRFAWSRPGPAYRSLGGGRDRLRALKFGQGTTLGQASFDEAAQFSLGAWVGLRRAMAGEEAIHLGQGPLMQVGLSGLVPAVAVEPVKGRAGQVQLFRPIF